MELREIRDRISAIDSEMAELFAERMEEVRRVAEYKISRGLAIEDRERELKLIHEKSALIEDPEIRSLYVRFLQSTMDISKSWQNRLMKGLRVSCAGGEGSAWHEAAERIFPGGNVESYEDFGDAYRAAEDGESDIAVLPLENSYDGEVGKVYDLIFSGDLYVNNVYALGCGGSTTRYAVLSRIEDEPGRKKDGEAFLIMFTVRDEPGGLAKAINVISAYGYNMRVLRSRPMKDLPWHYYFYAELEGDCSAEGGERIVRALQATCPVIKIKGCFDEDRDGLAGGAAK